MHNNFWKILPQFPRYRSFFPNFYGPKGSRDVYPKSKHDKQEILQVCKEKQHYTRAIFSFMFQPILNKETSINLTRKTLNQFYVREILSIYATSHVNPISWKHGFAYHYPKNRAKRCCGFIKHEKVSSIGKIHSHVHIVQHTLNHVVFTKQEL